MNETTEISKKSKDGQLGPDNNSESPARWVIHCIACEEPVEPWQTSGYEFRLLRPLLRRFDGTVRQVVKAVY